MGLYGFIRSYNPPEPIVSIVIDPLQMCKEHDFSKDHPLFSAPGKMISYGQVSCNLFESVVANGDLEICERLDIIPNTVYIFLYYCTYYRPGFYLFISRTFAIACSGCLMPLPITVEQALHNASRNSFFGNREPD
jgi:hypothetical protein